MECACQEPHKFQLDNPKVTFKVCSGRASPKITGQKEASLIPAGWIRKEGLRRRSKFNSAGIINKRERRKLGRSTIMNQPLMTMASSFVMPSLISMCLSPRDDSRDLWMKLTRGKRTARFPLVSFYSRKMEDNCWKYQFGHLRYKYDDYFQSVPI